MDLRIADEVRRGDAEERVEREGPHLDSLFRRDPAEDVHHLDDMIRSNRDLHVGRREAVCVQAIRAEMEALEAFDGDGGLGRPRRWSGLDRTNPEVPVGRDGVELQCR